MFLGLPPFHHPHLSRHVRACIPHISVPPLPPTTPTHPATHRPRTPTHAHTRRPRPACADVLTGPVRLLFPRIPDSVGEASFFPFSLLGLGDVAVPGLLACLALRYDASRAIDMRSRGQAAAQAIMETISSYDVSQGGGRLRCCTKADVPVRWKENDTASHKHAVRS